MNWRRYGWTWFGGVFGIVLVGIEFSRGELTC
jgi:hypothetical protein